MGGIRQDKDMDINSQLERLTKRIRKLEDDNNKNKKILTALYFDFKAKCAEAISRLSDNTEKPEDKVWFL